MKKQIGWAVLVAWLCCFVAISLGGRAQAETLPRVEIAFSPDGGAEALVLRTIGEARQSIRVLAYSFTAPAVTRALIAAKRRGVDVAVTADARSNLDEDRSGRARAALGALTYAGIPAYVSAPSAARARPLRSSSRLLRASAVTATSTPRRFAAIKARVTAGAVNE